MFLTLDVHICVLLLVGETANDDYNDRECSSVFLSQNWIIPKTHHL